MGNETRAIPVEDISVNLVRKHNHLPNNYAVSDMSENATPLLGDIFGPDSGPESGSRNSDDVKKIDPEPERIVSSTTQNATQNSIAHSLPRTTNTKNNNNDRTGREVENIPAETSFLDNFRRDIGFGI